MEEGFGDTARSARKATAGEVQRLAQALADAFYENPAMQWFLPDDARRRRRLPRLFSGFLRKIYLPADLSYTLDDNSGGALWMPPGKWHLSVPQQARMAPDMLAVFGRGIARALRGLALIESHHPHEPHYYLPWLGVEPRSQGRGKGDALLAPVLERCDRERVAAYLEATAPRARQLYIRNGFEQIEEFELPDGPPVWPMWREPGRRG